MPVTPTLTWQVAPSVLAVNIRAYGERVLAGLHALADAFAARIAAWMRSNAPWSDQTGAARAGLYGLATKMATGVVITLGHSVFYGIFLELGTVHMAPRPIIMEAMSAHLAAIAAALQGLVA